MRLRLDLHVHTEHSLDSRIRVDELIRRCKQAGLDGFAVTDHDTLSGVSEAVEKGGDLVVVPGVEVSAQSAHILALDASDSIPSNLTLAETVERIHGQGAIAVIAHPYSLLKASLNEREIAKAKLDAVEVANSSHLPYRWMLKRNTALAKRLGLPGTGGSDAHILEAVGRAYTLVEAESKEVSDIMKSIKKGSVEVGGSGVTMFEKIRKLVTA